MSTNLRSVVPFAHGQVAVVAFAEAKLEVTTLNALQTVLIIKPQATFTHCYFKFPGGMVEAGETFIAAAVRELYEETGIVAEEPNVYELSRSKKSQFPPHSGDFDVVLYVAFNCDFKNRFLGLLNEFGDDSEESVLVPFNQLAQADSCWALERDPQVTGTLFPPHQRLLLKAAGRSTSDRY